MVFIPKSVSEDSIHIVFPDDHPRIIASPHIFLFSDENNIFEIPATLPLHRPVSCNRNQVLAIYIKNKNGEPKLSQLFTVLKFIKGRGFDAVSLITTTKDGGQDFILLHLDSVMSSPAEKVNTRREQTSLDDSDVVVPPGVHAPLINELIPGNPEDKSFSEGE